VVEIMAEEKGDSPLEMLEPVDQSPDFDSLTVPLASQNIKDYDTIGREIELPPELVCDLLPKNGRLSLKMSMIMRIYLATLAETGRHSAACARAQVSRAHALEFRNKYPKFQALCDEALERFTGSIEAEVHRRAVHGTAEPVYHQGEQVGVIYKKSDRLLELMLKRRDPAYREAASGGRTTVNVSAQATAVAQGGPAPGVPQLDPSRMNAAQRAAYRAFLATMGPPELAPAQEPTESPQPADSDAVEVLPRGVLPARGEDSGDD
jgi:hypothetical protein